MGVTLPRWIRMLVVLVGIGLTVYDTVFQDQPSFWRIVLYAAMMGLLSGDAFERIIGFVANITRGPEPPAKPPEAP